LPELFLVEEVGGSNGRQKKEKDKEIRTRLTRTLPRT